MQSLTNHQLARATEWASILDHPGISKEIAGVPHQPDYNSVLTTAWYLLEALAYLEQYHVIHGNIQPDTVVLGIGARPQLTNFAAARLYSGMWSSNFGLNSYQVQQPYQSAYRAPEVWANEHYDCRTDIWALGCLLYRWVTGQDFMGPFMDNTAGSPQPADQATFNNQILDIDVRLSLVQLPAGLTTLIQQMLDLDKITRPFASELLKSAVFAGRQAQRGGNLNLVYPYPLAVKQSVEQRQTLVSEILKQAKAVLVLSEADDVDTVGDATTTQMALASQSLVLADVLTAKYQGSSAELAKEVVYLLTGLAGLASAELKLNPAVVNYATLNYYSSGIRSIASNYLRLAQQPAWLGLDVSTALQSLLEFTELQGLVILPMDTLN